MLLFLRKLFFYVFLGLYLLITPYAILYAFGYLVNPHERAFVKTGLVSITSNPHNATIFVEGKKYSEKTPAVVRELLPGRYRLRVHRKGYMDWGKLIEIEPEKATQLEPVVLLPFRPEEETISHQPGMGFIPAILESKVYTWSAPSLKTLNRTDLFFRKEIREGDEIPEAKDYQIEDVLTEEGSAMALIKARGPDKQIVYLLLDPGEEKKMTEQLMFSLPKEADLIHWNPKVPYQIFALLDGDLYRMDFRKDKSAIKIAGGILGFGIKRGRLYLLNKDFTFTESNLSAAKMEPLLLGADRLGTKIFSRIKARYYQIEVMDSDLILFRSSEGALISNRLPYLHLEKGVEGIRRSPVLDDDRILFWTGTEIGLLDFRRDKDVLFEREPYKTMLFPQGKNIRQVFWVYENSHVLFVDENEVYLLEAKGPKPYLVRSVTRIKANSRVFYHEREHVLYYLEPSQGYLIRRKLVE